MGDSTNQVQTPNQQKPLPWIISLIAASALFACMGLTCGVPLGFWWRGPVANVDGAKPDGAKKNGATAGKEHEGWGFQDIQDHLAKKGIRTSRGAGRLGGRTGMWYSPGDGEPLDVVALTHLNTNELREVNFDKGSFLAEPRESPEAASREVASIADVQQKKALAWSKYVFHGSSAKLAELKAALP